MSTTISMYQASVPALTRGLMNLSVILKLAEEHATAKSYDPNVLLGIRLAPDMFDLKRQVQIASDTAKGCVARLAGVEPIKFEDNETSFEQLQQRIAKTVDYLKTFTPAQIDGSEDKAIVLSSPRGAFNFTGMNYLLHFVLPNFYFHVTTTYDILRQSGVVLGKMDYLGKVAE